MCDFISERAAQLLETPRHKSTHTIVGISSTTSQTKGITRLNLATLSDNNVASQHPFHILDKIAIDIPRSRLAPEVFKMVKPYVLADPTFHLPSGIDVLLGVSLFPLILTHQTHSIGENMPYLIGTKFGFVVMGSAPVADVSSSAPCTYSSFLSTSDNDLHSSIQKFWTQEEIPQCSSKTLEEQQCDKHFSETHTRNQNGQYVVRLPFKANHPPLGTSYLPAQRRLYSLERKFAAQSSFRDMYVAFMDEYLSLGHMTNLETVDLTSPHYYLPHHGVLKENSSSTNFVLCSMLVARPVLDCR
ncbi:uncharacterized protein LOC129002296 [Macrosteles quadrilineatus]|uniref:uncharacterized protein LOC129002296 n=1 Tax=Macrosteles quadrilineatus TaxID=74068 RepID=UPI0023E0EB5C|nr:uncharacterized protein LOC129002296 [Macrosteles quadrilineatus]